MTKRNYQIEYPDMRINLEVNDIEAFATVATVLNFKAAALRLNMSASALSRRVQKLEEQLGVRLLDRTTRQVTLTLGGRQLLERSTDILAQFDEAVMSLKGDDSPRSSSIAIGAIPSIAHRLLPAALRLFHARYPATRVSVRDMTTNEVVNAVSSGETAFGITSFVQHDPTLEFRPLLRGRIVAAMPKDHALAAKERLRWADLRDHALISTWKGAGIRMVMDVDLARARDRLSPLYEVQQMYTALRFVEEGLGVAPVPDFFLGRHEYERLHVAPLIEPTISVDLGAILSRRHKMTTMGQHLLDAITAICANPRG